MSIARSTCSTGKVSPYIIQDYDLSTSLSKKREIPQQTENVVVLMPQATGSQDFFSENLSHYSTFYTFASSYIENMEDNLIEFDEFLKDNFWDLLA